MKIDVAVVKLLLTGGIILITAIVFSGDRVLGYDFNYRLSKGVTPMHYDIYLILDIDEHTGKVGFHGELSAFIYIDYFQKNIDLHALHIKVEEKTIQLIDSTNKTFNCISTNYNNEAQILTLNFEHKVEQRTLPLPAGNYTLNIQFNSTNDNEGFLSTFYENKENKTWFIVTNFLPIGARQVFPCWDQPDLKTTFAISVKYPRKYKVLTNTVYDSYWCSKAITDTDGTKREKFTITPKTSTYQMAIILFDLHSLKNIYSDRHYFTMQSRPNASVYSVRTIADNVINDFRSHQYFNISEKITKTDFVAIPGFEYDAISYWGLIFYREGAITYDEKFDHMMRKVEVTRVVARSLAQQWFSNLISPLWWSSYWLNDGLAGFFGIDAIDKYFPKFRVWDLFVVQELHESFRLAYVDESTYPLQINSPSEINSLFSSPKNFYKAISILRMLQHLVTNKAFLDGVREYLKIHSFNPTTLNNLWTAIRFALNNLNFTEILDLQTMEEKINNWIKLKHPVVKVTRDDMTSNVQLEMEDTTGLYFIPVTYTTSLLPNFTTNRILTNNNYFDTSLNNTYIIPSININNWIIINIQQVGYYRVNYDLRNWENIARYLNERAHQKYKRIHVLNRAQMIDDAFHFMVTRKLNASTFWKLTSYLWRETDYVAWYPMIKALEYMSIIFPFPDPTVLTIKTKVLESLNGLLERIGYNEKEQYEDYLTECLKQEAVKWACILGGAECKSNATEQLKWHRNTTVEHKLSPWWKEWVYCKGLMSADFDTWIRIYQEWLSPQKNDDRTLEFLGCSETQKNIDVIFTNIIGNINTNRWLSPIMEKRIQNLLFILAKHAQNNFVLRNMFRFIEELKLRRVNGITVIIIAINNIYSEEQLNVTKWHDMIAEYADREIKEATANLTKLLTNSIIPIKTKIGIPSDFMKIEEERSNVKVFENLRELMKRDIINTVMINIERKIKTRLSHIEKHRKYIQVFSIEEK